MNIFGRCLAYCALLLLLCSCSMTREVPDGDQLYTGLKEITYVDPVTPDTTLSAELSPLLKEEMEAALACPPNGSLFGSSKYRLPFSFGVWVWNKYHTSETGFGRWMTKSFGKQPVLMSWVNPMLRAQVAQNVLRNNGYFSGRVSYDILTADSSASNKKAKLAYHVFPGRVTLLDSIGYFGFTPEADSLIRSSLSDAAIHRGDPFAVSALDSERSRISRLLRNNGYYYFQPSYASYLADTLVRPGYAQLRLQMADSLHPAVMRQWYIGRVTINMRKSFREELTDSLKGRFFTVRFAGKKPPLRTRVLMADMKLRPRRLYSYDDYQQSVTKLNAMGLFSSTDFVFTARPKDGQKVTPASPISAFTDTLDLTLNCVFSRPWDFYIETNVAARSVGRVGPELRMGVTRRNAFRGGEKIDVNIHGTYEWSTHGGSAMNNYSYGADASIEFPRIIAPFFGGNRRTKDGRRRRRFYATPSTLAKVSADIVCRPEYYKMHVVSGEWTYRWQSSAQSSHEFSPLTAKYQFMNSWTSKYDELIDKNPYLKATMQDYFIPQMRYTYIYHSPSDYQNPIRWETTLQEAGNVVSLGYAIAGKSWSEKDKKLFRNPYSQFVKVETDLTKTWRFSPQTSLVGHLNGGYLYYYGNSNWMPNIEMFHTGGANSIRAFSERGIGPGAVPVDGRRDIDYLLRNGAIKLVGNLELRHTLFGSLQGAVFLDAGNVWMPPGTSYDNDDDEAYLSPGNFKFRNILKESALATGVGIRYDLSFLILRLDWGFALHLPFDTTKSGYFNNDVFHRYQTLHFAIGYPF